MLLFVLFALFVWAIVGMMPRGNDYEAKRAAARVEKLKTATDEAQTTLHTYGWVEKDKAVAHIPIGRAMQLTVADLANKKPAPAGPIATPTPATAPAPATASPGAGPAVPSPAPAASAAPNASPQTSHSGPGSVMGNQPAAAANPENAPPGTQPGPSATPAAAPPPPSEQPPVPPSERGPTPVQTSAGTPIPVRPEHP